jgi:hypothetical protein
MCYGAGDRHTVLWVRGWSSTMVLRWGEGCATVDIGRSVKRSAPKPGLRRSLSTSLELSASIEILPDAE